MTGRRPGDRLFRAWGETPGPFFDEEAGRARFLERFAAGKARAGRRLVVVMAAAAVMTCAVALGWWRTQSTVSFTTAAGEGQPGAWLATSRASELGKPSCSSVGGSGGKIRNTMSGPRCCR